MTKCKSIKQIVKEKSIQFTAAEEDVFENGDKIQTVYVGDGIAFDTLHSLKEELDAYDVEVHYDDHKEQLKCIFVLETTESS